MRKGLLSFYSQAQMAKKLARGRNKRNVTEPTYSDPGVHNLKHSACCISYKERNIEYLVEHLTHKGMVSYRRWHLIYVLKEM